MRKCFIVLLALAFAVSVCVPAYAAGNKNDLAYLSIDELSVASDVQTTDGVLLTRGSVPYQGMTVSEFQKVGVGNLLVRTTTDETIVLASDTGRIFYNTQSTKFQLPAAADGLTYTFVVGGAGAVGPTVQVQISTTPGTIVLAGADGHHGIIASNPAATVTATTGTTVTLASDGTNWYAFNVSPGNAAGTSTWISGGEWKVLDMGAQE